jgi:hypothetical protein
MMPWKAVDAPADIQLLEVDECEVQCRHCSPTWCRAAPAQTLLLLLLPLLLPLLLLLPRCRAPFPDVARGLACDVQKSLKGETWWTAASRLNVDVAALMRSNPSIVTPANGVIPPNTKMFMPPCRNGIDGWLEGVKTNARARAGPAATTVMRVPRPSKGQSMKAAIAQARKVEVGIDSPL